MSHFRRLLPLALAPVALALTGCTTVVGQSGSQLDVVGKVRVHADLCPGQSFVPAPGAPPHCYIQQGGTHQELVAVRLPAGAETPSTVTVAGPYGRTITLAASPSYSAALAAAYPNQTGAAWHGYAATSTTTSADSTTSAVGVDIDVTLPHSAGAAYSGPLQARVITGYREVDGSQASLDAAVVCGGTTYCAYSGSTATDDGYATRDLAIESAPVVTAAAGTTASLSFPVHFRGSADASATFAQSADTTLPGATATAVHASIAPSTDEDRTEVVDVAVPAGATPGDYPVTLKATVGGQERTATATLHVEAAPVPAATTVGTAETKPADTAVTTVDQAKLEQPKAAAPAVAPKRDPLSISLSARPSKRMGGANRVHVEGTVHKALGITKAVGCRGTVTVRARYADGDVARFTRKVSGSCRFAADVRLARTGEVTVTARFHGNGVLAPMTSGERTVSVG